LENYTALARSMARFWFDFDHRPNYLDQETAEEVPV
jgi:hypothetical protein